MKLRHMAIAVGALIIVPGLLWFAVSQVVQVNASPITRALDMTYEVSGVNLGRSGQVERSVLRYVRDVSGHWRVDTILNTGFPEVAGSWAVYDGDSIESFNAASGETSTTERDPVYKDYPEEWLTPGWVNRQVSGGGTLEPTEMPNVSRITSTYSTPCDIAVDPTDCVNGAREVKQIVVFENDTKIPRQITYMTNGKVTNEVRVTNLVWP